MTDFMKQFTQKEKKQHVKQILDRLQIRRLPSYQERQNTIVKRRYYVTSMTYNDKTGLETYRYIPKYPSKKPIRVIEGRRYAKTLRQRGLGLFISKNLASQHRQDYIKRHGSKYDWYIDYLEIRIKKKLNKKCIQSDNETEGKAN